MVVVVVVLYYLLLLLPQFCASYFWLRHQGLPLQCYILLSSTSFDYVDIQHIWGCLRNPCLSIPSSGQIGFFESMIQGHQKCRAAQEGARASARNTLSTYIIIYIYCIYLSLLHFMFASISLQLFKAYLDFIMFSICGRIPFGTSLPSTNPLVFCEKT